MVERGDPTELDECRLFEGEGRVLRVLQAAHLRAEVTGVDRWQVAVRVVELEGLGVMSLFLRCLMARGCVEHAHEVTGDGDDTRAFTDFGSARITEESVFLLAESFARRLPSRQLSVSELIAALRAGLPKGENGAAAAAGEARPVAADSARPRWDAERRELWKDGELVLRFPRPAEIEEAIVAGFEHRSWSEHITRAGAGGHNRDPKRQNRDAVYRLNRRQPILRMIFGCRGGDEIWWREPVAGEVLEWQRRQERSRNASRCRRRTSQRQGLGPELS